MSPHLAPMTSEARTCLHAGHPAKLRGHAEQHSEIRDAQNVRAERFHCCAGFAKPDRSAKKRGKDRQRKHNERWIGTGKPVEQWTSQFRER